MIQSILFKRNHFNIKDCKHYLKINKIKYLSYHITDNLYRFRLVEPNYNKYIYRIERNYNGNKYIDYIIQISK